MTTVVVLPIALDGGCNTRRPVAEEVIESFVTAVQGEDLDALYCRFAGASQPSPADPAGQRAAFDAWARSRYDDYLNGRDSGGSPLGDDGIVLVKTFALGKGAFYELDSVRTDPDGNLDVVATVRLGYAHVNYSSLSAGTTFYLAAPPPGRVEAIRIPSGSLEVSAEVLETVRLRWTLQRAEASPACAERWAVLAVRPIAGSETTTVVRWLF